MDKQLLFTDGSVNSKEHIGYGAYLLVQEEELLLDWPRAKVKVKRFENTSSTKLELQTLIWALEEIQVAGHKVKIYTDSQNIIGLPRRRNRLEQNDYRSQKNKLLNNHELYRAFFSLIDQLDCELIKVQGHLSLGKKDKIDRLFTLVDRASRKALRER